MDEAIVNYIKRNYNMLIGERTAEDVKISIGSAARREGEEGIDIRGRDLVTGLPRTLPVSAQEIRDALAEPVGQIVEAIKVTLERTPSELASDIMDRGIVLTGGGALLTGLDQLVSEETGMPVVLTEEPLLCVVRGTGKILEEIDTLRRLLITPKRIG
jgi:rod shape-determining protein MreB